MPPHHYDDEVEIRRFAPAPAAVIWGALMVASLAGAATVVLRAPVGPQVDASLQAAVEERALRRDVARLSSQRDELAGRLASLERAVGEVKLAQRSSEPDSTGSINRPQQAPASPSPTAAKPAGFALSLGPDASIDAVRRRWTALQARYPQQLARLAPRAQRSGAPGVFDLLAGPFASRAEAERACAALAEQGLACDTTDFVGDPIGRP